MSDFLQDIAQDYHTDLDKFQVLIDSLEDVRKEISELEAKLDAVKERERRLSSEEIPVFLQSRGISSLKLANGKTVEVKEDIKLSLPKDEVKRGDVFRFIIDNGGEDIIKEQVIIKEADDHLKTWLIDQGISFEDVKDIHSSTLKAFFNDLLGNKKNSVQKVNIEDIPKALNLFMYKKTNIKGA